MAIVMRMITTAAPPDLKEEEKTIMVFVADEIR